MPAIRNVKREARSPSTPTRPSSKTIAAVELIPTQPQTHPRHLEGDCTLTSSDGVVFKIDSIRLSAASPELAALDNGAAFSRGSGMTADRLATFLDYVRNEPTEPVTEANVNKMCTILRFSERWGCDAVRRIILGDILRGALSEAKISPNSLFSIAGEFDDPAIAVYAIRCCGDDGWTWTIPTGKDTVPDVLKERENRTCMDPRTWSAYMFEKTSPLYISAFLRALLPYDLNNMRGDSWRKVATRFEELLKLGRMPEHKHN